MEFSLVHFQRVAFEHEITPFSRLTTLQAKVDVQLGSKDSGGCENPADAKFLAMLENSLVRNTGSKRQRFNQQPVNYGLDIFVGFKTEPELNSNFVRVTSSASEDCVFSRLETLCGGLDEFTVSFELEFGTPEAKIMATAEDKQVQRFPGDEPRPMMGLIKTMDFPPVANEKWRNATNFTGVISVTLKLSDKALNRLSLEDIEDPLRINRKMMTDTATMDAVLIAAGGEQIKCHKIFLSAHSPVFAAMFESAMQEGISSTVQLPTMTGPGVQALIAYLYCWELEAAFKCPSISLELLMASDQYHISSLEKKICEIILAKDPSWLTVSVAVPLLQFTRKKTALEDAPDYRMIERKIVGMLKSVPEEQLLSCSELHEFFQDPKAALEFCIYLSRFQ